MPISAKQTPLQRLTGSVRKVTSDMDDLKKKDSDFTRNRCMNAERTVNTVLNMESQTLNRELRKAFINDDIIVSESAFEQQKAKLCPEVFRRILSDFNSGIKKKPRLDGKYKINAIDGSDANLPRNKNSIYLVTTPSGRPRKDGKPIEPYSQAHMNIMFDCTDEVYEDIVIQPKQKADERDAAIELIDRMDLSEPTIVLMDRGYESLNLIEHCNRAGNNLFYVIRMKCTGKCLHEIKMMPDGECDNNADIFVTTSSALKKTYKGQCYVHYIKSVKHSHKKYMSSNTRYQRWDYETSCHVKTRLVKVRINDPETGKQEYEVLATNLPRDEFPLKRMKELYHVRWNIEVSFRNLKYALSGLVFHSRRDDFNEMEMIAHLIMYNAVSQTINAAALPQKIGNKHIYAISFTDTVSVVREYFRYHCTKSPDRIFAEIMRYTHPVDSGPATVRNLKQKSAVSLWFKVA